MPTLTPRLPGAAAARRRPEVDGAAMLAPVATSVRLATKTCASVTPSSVATPLATAREKAAPPLATSLVRSGVPAGMLMTSAKLSFTSATGVTDGVREGVAVLEAVTLGVCVGVSARGHIVVWGGRVGGLR